MKKDKGELLADIFCYGLIALIVGAVIALVIGVLVKEFVG